MGTEDKINLIPAVNSPIPNDGGHRRKKKEKETANHSNSENDELKTLIITIKQLGALAGKSANILYEQHLSKLGHFYLMRSNNAESIIEKNAEIICTEALNVYKIMRKTKSTDRFSISVCIKTLVPQSNEDGENIFANGYAAPLVFVGSNQDMAKPPIGNAHDPLQKKPDKEKPNSGLSFSQRFIEKSTNGTNINDYTKGTGYFFVSNISDINNLYKDNYRKDQKAKNETEWAAWDKWKKNRNQILFVPIECSKNGMPTRIGYMQVTSYYESTIFPTKEHDQSIIEMFQAFAKCLLLTDKIDNISNIDLNCKKKQIQIKKIHNGNLKSEDNYKILFEGETAFN